MKTKPIVWLLFLAHLGSNKDISTIFRLIGAGQGANWWCVLFPPFSTRYWNVFTSSTS
ncbi:stage II sporulation protein R [Bacillus sp. sid0103]|nr:stage II sporulation protein R [Bacillus sp. sid0103]